ncbi:MAG: hypothetical protein ACREBC_04665 [Pyrinomonadaceae bacterium]
MKRKSQILVVGIAGAALVISGVSLVVRKSLWSKPQVQTRRYPHQHLPLSGWEPNAKLTEVSHTLSQGESLARVATLRYGHQNYYHVIKLYNHIENEANVATGATLRLPDISHILAEAGFTKVAAAEMELILCARAKYDQVSSQMWALRQDRPLRERVVIPEKVRQELLEAADDLERATENLKGNKPGVTRPPLKMIGQLEACLWGMRELAEGSNDGYGYDIDIVHQRYALGIMYAIIWARDGFK